MFAAAASIPLSRAEYWLPLLEPALDEAEINTPARQAAFIAQTAHETGGYTRWVENLNYSTAERIYEIFKSRFASVDDARPYVRSPQRLANRVYANRGGNGSEESGDGFRYRGRGWIQITFFDGYLKCGSALELDLMGQPELLEQEELAVRSAAWWWLSHGLNDYADGGAINAISGIINRGSPTKRAVGAAEREYAFIKAMEAIG
jgi:putative chitinase